MQLEPGEWRKGESGNCNGGVNQIGGSRLASLLQWINNVLPHLNLPLETSEEELRVCLADGSILCGVLEKLVCGSVEEGGSLNERADIKRFLTAMDELGFPGFELSDIEQGSMLPVLQCLETLQTHFIEYIHGSYGKKWDQSNLTSMEDGSKFRDAFGNEGRPNVSVDSKVMDLLKSNNLDSVSTQLLFNVANRILGDIFERKSGDLMHRQLCLLRKILQVVEWRSSNQAEGLKNQNKTFKACEGRYQSRLNALETLAIGTNEENEIVTSWVQQLQFALQVEKTKLDEKKKLEEQDVTRLKKDKVRCEVEISSLKQALEMAKKTHEEHSLQLELHAKEYKAEYDRRFEELECHLSDARKRIKELEAFSDSRYLKWKKKEQTYQSFINYQFEAFQGLRAAMESVKDEVLKTKGNYSEEFKYLGMKLKGLTEAAENYHVVLTENRKLYNEVQDLKGNIRVYCRIRPFLPGQNQNHTTIEFVGGNGEVIVSNSLKQGKENRKLFKFNKVFGPAASQEEVFMDTQPLIRSVLDGYNVCIFAYGQTGSGKTYTMSGHMLSSKTDWGVNYRALHDLFHISQSRRSSIAYEIGVQMVEIYNEQVRDLLSNNSPQKRLGIWSTAQPNGLAVPDASMHSVNSMTDVLELMNVGMMNRATSATALNERSSRSHSVLTVHVHGMDLETNALLRGCLHLVDLAGSERVDRSEAMGDRLKEAQYINKSLSALGDVIFALSQKSSHVPYRNSKLTQVLQSSLGGQAKTLMFVQLNPDVVSYSETISTLKFAERVSSVELGAARSNKEGRDVRELMEQLASLKDTIAKKDEDIERLQLPKANLYEAHRGTISLRYGPSSPRRHSMGTPRHSQRFSGARATGFGEKAASDMDNCSEYSDKHSETGSQKSVDDFRNKTGSVRSKLSREDINQNINEDIDLLGFGNVESEERLSDISDGGLSMGTETDGSISSIVEYTLFPGVEKPPEVKPIKNSAEENFPSENTQKTVPPTKIPKAPQVSQKPVQTKSSRLSSNRSSSKVLSNIKKTPAGSLSTVKAPKRWQ